MYVSHPVRGIADDPMEGESVALVVGFDGDGTSAEEMATRVEERGGDVLEVLPFESLKVRVEEEAVGEVCGIDGLTRVETANTISLGGGDAGRE